MINQPVAKALQAEIGATHDELFTVSKTGTSDTFKSINGMLWSLLLDVESQEIQAEHARQKLADALATENSNIDKGRAPDGRWVSQHATGYAEYCTNIAGVASKVRLIMHLRTVWLSSHPGAGQP